MSLHARHANARYAYLEVKRYQGEDQSLEVLYQIVENTEAFWIRRVLHVLEGADLCSLQSSISIQVMGMVKPTSKEMCSLPNRISSS